MIDINEIKKYFPEKDALAVQEVLSTYIGNEQDRVQLAILELAKGSIDGVKYHTDCAQKDYRDVIYWSEYPNEAEEAFKKLISGMTVNERLSHLNLFDEFDAAIAERSVEKLQEILEKCLLDKEDINAIIKTEINT